ncbi:uncharacterized protein LOC117169992 [Belonocnema kinseyi]|uniref:uncharacterized protein LOC117169992 n=1 Tax=Belonocnema kinseyi TaxID=2817044 RepID=UPI00143CF2DE|nr:uncharacterized protein LOC117169992 [Belonocnema kinseyi]
MYRQIQVHREDQDLQLILWRKSSEDPVQTFCLTTVTYGLPCAPFLAVRCLQQLAIDEGQYYPLATKAIQKGTYMDNVITGSDIFVCNRHLLEIQTTFPSAFWHYVPSASNPADCSMRGISAKNLGLFSLWWKGPDWLISSSIWPVQPLSKKKNNVDMKEREKLLPTTVWLIRFLLYRLHPSDPMKPVLTLSELHSANLAWIRHEQYHYFGAEINILISEMSLKNKLARLTPYIDAKYLLGVGGGLKNSILNPDEKHPPFLSSESTLTALLVDYHHQRCLHVGVQLTLGTLRQQYWILKGNQPQQLMRNLPAIRSSLSKPFPHTGVDYAGSIGLRTTKGRGYKSYKGYIAVFVCCFTRAVHLEVVSDYTANGFLAAYTRFVFRRGISKTLSRDQGTNFIGADANLRTMFSSASKQSKFVASVLAANVPEWRFNSLAAPHFGGLWEAAVKSSKHHIRRVLGDRTLTFEEMSKFLS